MREILRYVIVSISFIFIVSAKTLKLDNEFIATTKAGHDLMASSRSLEDYDYNDGYDMSVDFLAGYSIKFQNCHKVTQWDAEFQNSAENKIAVRRLVRYRLCPIAACNNQKSNGCSSKYGDFVVDINTFVYYFLLAKKQQTAFNCDKYYYICGGECYYDDNAQCEPKCYEKYDIDYNTCLALTDDDNKNYYYAYNGDDGDDGDDASDLLDPIEYAQCSVYDGFGNGAYYIGPYCSEEENNIHLAVFSDNMCTTFSSCDDSCFYEQMGFALPYSESSLITTDCITCADGEENNYYSVGPVQGCVSLYADSGKCETKMMIDTVNESACSYIDGMRFIREDGVITSTVRKSKLAAMSIGLGSVCVVMLGFYVHVLHTKLGRAQFNLNSGSSGAVL